MILFYLSQDKNIYVLHILWTFGLKRRSMQRGELYSEENFNIREIWKSQVIYCWGLEDKIWIKVGANMKYEIITLSASFILLSVLIGMVRSLYLSINSRELFNVKTNLLWIALLYPVIIHPSPFCPSHSLQNETWIYQIFRFSSVQLHHWKRKWWARFASSNTLNLKVWFQAEKSSQE